MFSASRPQSCDVWTAARARKESYATVLAACWFRMQLTIDEVRALFDALALPLPRTFTDADVGEVIAKALHAEDPYGR
ncbi:hypothetical protein [Streptomyces sp. CB03238]|uniref:hypothetical protein n=1 Tax=Streptomyces sp. CB03238 TaxID=1907777 RepID=UPI001F4DA481|nr:hypothetical protein [Streptomyces sp. CB03238]